MDDPKARDSRPGRPRPELPDSLAWLDDAPAAPAARGAERRDDGRFGAVAPAPPAAPLPPPLPTPLADADPERLPTLLPFSAPEPEPEPEPVAEPLEEPLEEPVAEPVAEAEPWPDPEPVRPPTFWRVPEPESEAAVEPQAVEEPDAADEEPVAVHEPEAVDAPEPPDTGGFNLFEPVPLPVPPEPPSQPLPLPAWNRFGRPPEPRPDREPPSELPSAHDPAADLADPALGPLWAAVRDVLQAPVRHTDPAVDVRGLDQAGRRAVAALLGVPAVRASMRIDLRELEDIVRAASGLDLAAAADRFVPLFVPARRPRAHSRTAPVRAGQEWLEEHPDMAARPWTATWLETLRRDVVGGDAGLTEYEVTTALEILAVLTEQDDPAPAGWRVRAELAGDVAGDEQALDEGSPVAALVVRGLASAAGWPPPADTAGRRRLWARFGVVPDLVSTTCLTLGVAPADPAHAARWESAAHDGDPVHVTPRDLRAAPGAWRPAVTGWDALLVVDSARVLEAVAERFPGRVAVVCTDGVPGPLVFDLLRRLHESGTPLRFVTDVDGPGLALGTLLAERFGAQAWRMSAADYRRAARSDLPPVTGRLATPLWDAELAAAVTQAGRAVPAEQVLGEILESLAQELRDLDSGVDGSAVPDGSDGADAADPSDPAGPSDPADPSDAADPGDAAELVAACPGGAVSG